MKLYLLTVDEWKMDGGVAFGVVPKSLWSKQVRCDDQNMADIVTRCLLVQMDGRLILFDAGMGRKQPERYYALRGVEPGHGIVEALANVGFGPHEVTDVVFTHLHDDHVGGATAWDNQGKSCILFQNARFWVSADHWQWAMHPNKRERASFFTENLQPLAESGRLQLITAGQQPFPGIALRFVNGHTRGQMIPLIEHYDGTLVFMADFIPTIYNLPIPFVPSVDVEPLLSMDEKESFLAEALSGKYILCFQHDKSNECCSLKNTEKGIQSDAIFDFNTLNLSI